MQNSIRIIHKHAIESVWNTKTQFIPYAGEFIVYDPDDTYSYARFKIGDGKTTIVELPFTKTEHSTTADRLSSARTITLRGDITGVASFDGSSNVTLITELTKGFIASFKGSEATHTHKFVGTPVDLQILHQPAGTIATTVTPRGKVEAPDITVNPTIKKLKVVTGEGYSSSYTPAECVFPKFIFSYDDENKGLNFSFTQGTYTPAEYTPGGALAATTINYVESIEVTAEEPAFVGEELQISADLTGATTYTTVEFTPEGTIEEATLSPEGEIIINYE